MPNQRDLGLILRRFPYGESSLVLHVLTREHGRVHVIAKGAYRPTSRYYAALDLFDTLELEWSARPGAELVQLVLAGIEIRRARISHDLGAFTAGVTALDLAALGSHEGHANAELFATLSTALDRLAAQVPPAAALVEFELAFLHNLGLAPALTACASCGGAAPPLEQEPDEPARAAFSASSGGRLCSGCAIVARAAGRRVGTLPASVLELGDAILARRVDAATLAEVELERVRDFVARFLEVHLESRPSSYQQFLAAHNRNARTRTP
ncbi:MAG: DNA repair protein RecO [Planctomycetota bacterium]|nr:DNA repair protein RecO [Planctomycetota bacterium]